MRSLCGFEVRDARKELIKMTYVRERHRRTPRRRQLLPRPLRWFGPPAAVIARYRPRLLRRMRRERRPRASNPGIFFNYALIDFNAESRCSRKDQIAVIDLEWLFQDLGRKRKWIHSHLIDC